MHRETTKELIERARRDSELVDGVMASIDITKSNPYRESTELEFDEGGLANTWLLGYKEEGDDEDDLPDIYFQWASIQIVGLDIPLVLDAIPVHRGLSRKAIVDELLETATKMVDIELLMMDREFAHSGVKDVCEDHGVWYLNPGEMRTSERATCTRLRRQGKLVHIEKDNTGSETDSGKTTLGDFVGDETADTEESESDDPVRKAVYVPAMKAERTSDDVDDEDDAGTQTYDGDNEDKEAELRTELLSEFAEATDDDVESVGRMFGDVIEDVREEEEQRDLPGNEEDTQLYMLFETNHPDLELPDNDDEEEFTEVEKAHMVSRIVRKYKHKWGIENGFKQIKRFRVRTTSMKYEYRFFNFLYACTMYNAWRLVDLLVKLELLAESEFRHKPLVTADLFLTIAKDYAGLDPPD
jgi:IS4 transposase